MDRFHLTRLHWCMIWCICQKWWANRISSSKRTRWPSPNSNYNKKRCSMISFSTQTSILRRTCTSITAAAFSIWKETWDKLLNRGQTNVISILILTKLINWGMKMTWICCLISVLRLIDKRCWISLGSDLHLQLSTEDWSLNCSNNKSEDLHQDPKDKLMISTQSLSSMTSTFSKHLWKHLKIAVTTPSAVATVMMLIKILVWTQPLSLVTKMVYSVNDDPMCPSEISQERPSRSMTKIS